MDDKINEEVLDSPLVVHKESDASYRQTASEVGMYATHVEEENSNLPTLERHRFKKKKKSKGKYYVILLVVIAVIAAVITALIYSGTISFREKETTTAPKKSYITQEANDFEGTIVIKGTYIFFEGKEVDGIGELEKEIKYLDKGKKFVIKDEKAESNFLNYEILPLLAKYEIDYSTEYIVSSGLTSVYETTQKATEKKTEKAEKKEKTTKSTAE